jgi:hypothetical protein
MNDLDALRAALHEPVVDDDVLDLGEIMKKGGRIRRRRRLVTAAIGSATALVLVVGGVQAGQALGLYDPPPGGSVAAPGGPTDVPIQDGESWGAAIRTGIASGESEWAIYMIRIDEPAVPGTPFGVVAGVRSADGALTNEIVSNETEGSSREPGFHAVSGSMVIDVGRSPVFGYYVGPAAKIVGGKGDSMRVAEQAAWSEDPSIVLFWYDPKDLPKGWKATGLTAYDEAGTKLPTGNNGAGVG